MKNMDKKRTLEKVKLTNYLTNIEVNSIKEEIFTGLNSPNKYISSKYFYNDEGSELFEQITKLKEYYPTRTEKKILTTITNKLNFNFSNLSIIELGSGDPSKIRLLLKQIPKEQLSSINYYPVDISQYAIENSAEILSDEFPDININGIVADFMHQFKVVPRINKRLFCLFGSTIGNFNKTEIKDFMGFLGDEMQIGDSLLLGMDMIKDIDILEKAYNDSNKITNSFNKNILNVINNLIDTNFEPANFEHIAFYNKKEERIEMHLKAKKDLTISVNSHSPNINFKKGETIHTENSHKFNDGSIEKIALWSGLGVEKILSDKNNWFSLVYLKKTK